MSATQTEIRIEDLEFTPPSPGSWELDLTHHPRPVARFIAEPPATYEEPFARGFIESLRRYGTVVLYPEYRFVNGFAYTCIRPVPEAEIPERLENAARAMEAKLWREDVRRWDEELKPVSIRAHLALQRIDPGAASSPTRRSSRASTGFRGWSARVTRRRSSPTGRACASTERPVRSRCSPDEVDDGDQVPTRRSGPPCRCP
jgi:hypothetical protein